MYIYIYVYDLENDIYCKYISQLAVVMSIGENKLYAM